MIRVLVLYPHSPGKRFDFNYYMAHHIPLVRRLGEGKGLKEVQVSKIDSGLTPGSPLEHVCAGTLVFESRDALERYLSESGAQILGDVPNYTDIQPVIQVGEVLV